MTESKAEEKKPDFEWSELNLKPGERYDPPEGTRIFQPFKGLTPFWPNDQPHREKWLEPVEQKYLHPFGTAVAQIFAVDLITDADYVVLDEDSKANMLFTVMTRADVREVRPGIFEWFPICVVVKYFIMVGVQVQLDAATQKAKMLMAQLWAKDQQAYVPVFDHVTGYIENPGVLLQVLEKYARLEGLC
jgi:hypothetical protein